MSYTKMMITPDEEQVINQDNKQYRFKPGKNGYLIAPAPHKDSMEETVNTPRPVKAKTIGPASPINVASVRG